MFPVWPFEVKYGIWLLCVYFLVVIVGLIVFRLVVYIIFAIFDYHIWIFPNLLNTYGFLEAFLPVVEISKGDRSWFNFFIRMFALSSFILMCLHIYMNPTFFDGTFNVI